MGYVTDFTGQIDITPPLSEVEVAGCPFLPESAEGGFGDRGRDLKLVPQVRHQLAGEQLVPVTVHGALVSTWEDDARGYKILEHLQEAIDLWPGHEFTGRIYAEGEEGGDIWRLEVRDRKAVKVKAAIVWPPAGALGLPWAVAADGKAIHDADGQYLASCATSGIAAAIIATMNQVGRHA